MMTAESGLSKPDWHTRLSKLVYSGIEDRRVRIKQAGLTVLE